MDKSTVVSQSFQDHGQDRNETMFHTPKRVVIISDEINKMLKGKTSIHFHIILAAPLKYWSEASALLAT